MDPNTQGVALGWLRSGLRPGHSVELARRETRLERIRQAKRALEERARAEAEEKGKDPEGARPADSQQYNFSDPETRLMKVSNQGFDQCGNAQAVVDGAHQVIVACAVTEQANDKRQWVPMLKRMKANLGCRWKALGSLVADNGYCSDANLAFAESRKLNAYIATGRAGHNALPPAAPKERMRRKLATRKGRAIYARRKTDCEPVFGQIKQGRGFTQFLLNGMEKMNAEWALVCASHNLLKFWRHAWLHAG